MSSQLSTSSPIRIRRARNVLGTFVEITASGTAEAEIHAAIDLGFAAIEKVDRLMSFHSDYSDLSKINSGALASPVKVDPWTFEVIGRALEFSNESGGLFDCTVASELMAWNLLPQKFSPCRFTYRQIKLLENFHVSFAQPLTLDLGGIAKGFAVDKAVEALRNAGIQDGIVNAGGDLRVFGTKCEPISLRDPQNPACFLGPVLLANAALATSSPSISLSKDKTKSSLVHGVTRSPQLNELSLSIEAPTCIVADALTKIICAVEKDWSSLLKRYGAKAFKVECGQIFVLD